MGKVRRLHFRVTDEQYARIKNNSAAKGYATVSSYLRSISLDSQFNEKFNEIYACLTGKGKNTMKSGK
ncbi:hypothetical protein HY638_03535 [Candidatus Woesearchaeota archaeon]|nr:hypothetical protein [Candidatus Woesearchaeota archaeon]